MTARLRTAVLIAALLVAGCDSHAKTIGRQSMTTGVSPVSSSILAPPPGTPAERQAVIQRFTQDIWPAVSDYNAHPGQGSPEAPNPAYAGFYRIIDQGLDTDAVNKLSAAAHHLGVVRDPDETQGGSEREDDLRLTNAQVTQLNPPDATVQVCYTFTALSYQGRQPVHTPTTSEATFELHKTDKWHLYAITNDHVVLSCPPSGA